MLGVISTTTCQRKGIAIDKLLAQRSIREAETKAPTWPAEMLLKACNPPKKPRGRPKLNLT